MNKSFVALLFIVLSSLSLSSCEIIQTVDDLDILSEKNRETFLIKRGEHNSSAGFKRLTTNRLRFEVVFDSTAVYQTMDASNQADINKLYGLSDCGTAHHTNSARFGWRWYNNRVEILAYTYVNQQRSWKLISTVEIGKPYVYELLLEDNQYVFLLNDVRIIMLRNCAGPGDGYLLYPYFGGDEVAPHDITIKIKELK